MLGVVVTTFPMDAKSGGADRVPWGQGTRKHLTWLSDQQGREPRGTAANLTGSQSVSQTHLHGRSQPRRPNRCRDRACLWKQELLPTRVLPVQTQEACAVCALSESRSHLLPLLIPTILHLFREHEVADVCAQDVALLGN